MLLTVQHYCQVDSVTSFVLNAPNAKPLKTQHQALSFTTHMYQQWIGEAGGMHPHLQESVESSQDYSH